ncbi:phage minor head protein [Williamwhitmania taraxaci]|uniref:Phage putative head morphogenesis protein, SPP1 gp7 family n=1 Tax=Williamwhitmania taraxaci TaxID=1640674 RepID=A0A1G6MBT9_9BACT|nr:phage minor head protein [Williamwhitmania taraxaci]SDC53068.1 phage putative head morphogenesis protein, SPP1 gp7 family [Williamwhitmania taraxaci]
MHPTAEAAIPADFARNLSSVVNGLAREIWNGGGLTSPKLLNLIGSLLQGQVAAGFGKGFPTVDFSTPDAAMLMRLTRDVWQFGAAKSYQQLRDMTLALKDAEGKMRSFPDFKEAVSGIGSKYNADWLKTEYNQAVGAATMAARWSDFKRNEKDMPYLRYSTVGDSLVRDSHRSLDGTVRKMSDAFWATYFPPNGWGCRCSADQLAASYAVETEVLPDMPVQPMFRTNLAASGLVFPKGHPYYTGVPAEALREAIGYLPPDAAYNRVYKSEASGKEVKLHILHGIAEAPTNIATGKVLADAGHQVELLPILQTDQERARIYGKGFVKGKNPDAKINGVLAEIKNTRTSSKTAIHNSIENGQEQADLVVIHLPKAVANETVHNAVKGKVKQARYVEEVWVINGDSILKYSRNTLGLPKKEERSTD